MAADPRLARTPRLNDDAAREPSAAAAPPWLRRLVYVMDDLIRLPGMDRGIGLDPIVGFLFPGFGDVLTALTTLALLGVAIRRQVPGVVLARMVLQQLVDMVLGSVPIAGDVFDVLNRANRQNLELIERHAREGVAPTAADRAWVAVAILIALGLVVLPFVVAYGLYEVLARLFAG